MENINLTDLVLRHIKLIKPDILEVSDQTFLHELAFDDIDFTELAIELEEELDIALDEIKISEMQTVKEVIKYVDEQVKSQKVCDD